MSKFKLSILLGFALIIIMGIASQRYAMACGFVGLSNYSEIAPKIFISPTIPKNKYDEIISIIEMGRERVNNTFGEMISFPNTVVTASKGEAASFGSNSTGKTHLTPFGACIVLGPEGSNVDVAAHEFVHAETWHRVGWVNHSLNVPIWFNEGVALLVDFRKFYLLENIDLSSEEVEFVKNSEFNFSLGNYQAARVLVDSIDKSNLYQNLERLKQGQDINSVFAL